MRKVSKLRPAQKAWVHAKISMAIWAVVMFIVTPTPVADALGRFITGSIAGFVIIGVIVSLVGMLRAQSIYKNEVARGIQIELAGLWVAIAGPLAYFAVQIFLALYGSMPEQRISTIFAFYSLSAFFYVRIVMVRGYKKKLEA